MMMEVDFRVHQAVEIVGWNAPDQDQPEIVAEELHGVVVMEDGGVLLENRALLRTFDVGLDRHQAVFPSDLVSGVAAAGVGGQRL